MLTKDECLSLLVKIEDKGINIDAQMKNLIISRDVPIDVLKFISANQGIEATNFYELLRKKHNKNKSPLYTNLLRETKNVDDIILTLNCLLTQILLYTRKLTENKEAFLKEVRAKEITFALNQYFNSDDPTVCLNLLKLIKTDLLVLDYLNDRRELQA